MRESWSELLHQVFVWVLIALYFSRHVLGLWVYVQIRSLVFRYKYKSKTHSDPVALAMAKHIFALTNKYRKANGLSRLKWHKKLYKSSLYHARRMRKLDEFEHTLSDGIELGERVERYGFAYRMVRENLFLHSDFVGATPKRMAKIMMKGWINSPGHKANLDADDITHLGVAVVNSKKGFYAVQNFGTPLL